MYIAHAKKFSLRLTGVVVVSSAILMSAYGSFQTYRVMTEYYEPYYLKAYAAAAPMILDNTLSQAAAVIGASAASDANSLAGVKPPARSIPILLYHGVVDEPDDINVTLDNFTDQMITLKKAGYETIPLSDFHSFLKGEKEVPEKSFIITFDDGRKDSYYPVDPLLRGLQWSAVMFAVENYSRRETDGYYLTLPELKKMTRSGRWEIESHAKTHRDLTAIPEIDLFNEIGGSQTGLETLLGTKIDYFAFPFGEFGQAADESEKENHLKEKIMNLARDHYLISFFQFYTPVRYRQNYPNPDKAEENYLVKRINVQSDWSGQDLLKVLEASAPKELPFEASFSPDEGWVNTLWGELEANGESLQVKALPDSTGSATILDGSGLWENYELSAEVNWRGGSNIYIWARYQNDYNYVACNFGNNLAHIEETFEGQTSVIRGDELSIPEEKKNNPKVGIRVQGRNVSCLFDGEVVVETNFLNESMSRGGIGFKAWSQNIGEADMKVNKLTVEPINE